MARVRIKGPWRGMDLRDNSPGEGTSRLMLNMENKAGVLRPRSCVLQVSTAIEKDSQLHFVDRPGLARVILSVGVSGSGVRVDGLDEWGETLFSNVTLTTELPRQANGDAFRCSFIDTFLSSADGTPRPATLIVCPNATWVYEPLADATTVRLAVVSTDAVQENTANIGYWASLPRGPIATVYDDCAAYAGFQDGVDVLFDSPLEDDATDVPANILAQNRASIRLSPGLLVISDPYDPIGIPAPNFFFIPNETITGLHATGEALLVFTDKSIYGLTGYSLQTFSLQLLVRGTGCVSHWSIVTAGGVTYFASQDGIYAFGGMGAPEVVKISEGLSPLWDGWDGCSTFLPDPMRARLTSFGFPWTLKQDVFYMTCGRHNRKANQIWWSYAATGPALLSYLNMTLVFDLDTRGWSLFFGDPSETEIGSGIFPFMSDAIEANGKWYWSSSVGILYRFDSHGWDGKVQEEATQRGVPAFWLSQRIAPDDADWKKVLDTRVKLLSRGQYASAYGGDAADALGSGAVPKDLPYFVLSGEAENFDILLDSGTAATYSQRGSTCTGRLLLTPHAGMPTLDSPGSNPAWTLNTSPWIAKDWFSSRCEGQIGAKSFRFGLVDDAWANTRGPKLAVAAIEFDILEEGTMHR